MPWSSQVVHAWLRYKHLPVAASIAQLACFPFFSQQNMLENGTMFRWYCEDNTEVSKAIIVKIRLNWRLPFRCWSTDITNMSCFMGKHSYVKGNIWCMFWWWCFSHQRNVLMLLLLYYLYEEMVTNHQLHSTSKKKKNTNCTSTNTSMTLGNWTSTAAKHACPHFLQP